MKILIIISIFLINFCSFSQCSEGVADTYTKTSEFGTKKRFVKVTNTGKNECKLLIQIKLNSGNWCTAASRTLKPTESYTGSCQTKSSEYRWALVDKDGSAWKTSKDSLWKTK